MIELFESLKRLFLKESRVTQLIIDLVGRQPQWTPVNYEKYAKEGYQQNVYVYSCIRAISMACAGIPWLLFNKTKGGELKEIENHELLDLIARPNPQQGSAKFVESVIGNLMISGNSYIEAVGPDSKSAPPKELYCLRPDRIQIVPGNALELIAAYQYDAGGRKVDLPPEKILHLKTFNPVDDWYGMPPLQAAARSVDQNNESKAWNVSMLQNSARPSGILRTDGNLSDDQFMRLKAELSNNWSGYKNASLPKVLEGGLTWQEMSFSPVDMSWTDGMRMSAREIAIAFGVPPELVGDNTNKTYCLTGDTMISTPNGAVPIKDIEVGNYVWSLVDGEMVQRKVLISTKTGKDPIYEIKLHGSTIKCNATHPFLVRESYWVDAPKEGNRMSKEKRYRLVYKPAGDLTRGDVLVVAYQYPEVMNDNGIDLELMEFYGAMLGDGFCEDYGCGRAIVSMAGNKGSVRDFYQNVAQKHFTKVDGSPINIKEHDREFRFISKGAVNELKALGLSGTAKTKCIPTWVYNQSRDAKMAFVRGLIDTDGSVDKNGRMTFHVANEKLAKQVRFLVRSMGIPCSNIQYTCKNAMLPDGTNCVNELWGFMLTSPEFNLQIGSRDLVDSQRLIDGASKIKFKGRRKASEGTNHCISTPDNCEFIRIKDIQLVGVEDVYDIEVEESHNFFANDICVHNSNYQEARMAFYMETVLPLMDWYRDELNNWLVPMFGENLELDYDKDEIEALSEDRQEVWTRCKDAYWLTLNEIRVACGYDETDSEYGEKFKFEIDAMMSSGEKTPAEKIEEPEKYALVESSSS